MHWARIPVDHARASAVVFLQAPRLALEQYLQKALALRAHVGEGTFRFFFCRLDETQWFPLESPFSSDLRRLKRLVEHTGQPVFQRVVLRQRPFLALGFRCESLPEFVLFALYPESLVDGRVTEAFFRSRLWLFLLTLGVLTLAGLLSGPVVRTLRGLEVLQGFQKRLLGTYRSIDETDHARAGAALDSLLESQDEINAARLLQQGLFPRHILSRGTVRVFGLSRPARDLGGDYFDYHAMSDGRLLVVIGDVTGHGVPAALVVSMAKAVVTDYAANGRPPEELLDRLDEILTDTVKRKRFMTFALLVIDPHTGEGAYYNCGHPYPVLWEPGAAPRFLEAHGFFLGRRMKGRCAPTRFRLLPGGRFLFFSDGVIESLMANPFEDCFQAFLEYVAARPRLSLQEACQDLLQSHPAIASGKPLPDDFTLVLVERLSPSSLPPEVETLPGPARDRKS